jgi:putative ABC transport system permease protein
MRSADLVREMFLGVLSNKVRSGLTMLGIVIGIGSVIAMLGVGQGAQAQIQANIQAIGSNLLLVTPGAQRGVGAFVSTGRGSAQTLTNEDLKALDGIASVSAVAGELSQRLQVVTKGMNTNTQVVGTEPSYVQTRNVSIASGSFFSEAQLMSDEKVAVLGPTTVTDLFGANANPIGQQVRINGLGFTVIGVTAPKGTSGFQSQDDMVIIPLSSMQLFITGGQYVSTVSIEASDQSSMAIVQSEVTTLLLKRHHIASTSAADFSVLNQSDVVNTASSVTGTFTALLASIAGISLLVGGIGIMNMMLTTVSERTREIGLRKAIGAEDGAIVGQFLGEAIVLTLCGGAIGILLGYSLSLLITRFAQIPTSISSSSILLAFGVSAGIGLVFGYYPARRASRLNPIEALRYE